MKLAVDCAVAVTVANPRLPATTRKATAMRARRVRRAWIDRFGNPAGAFFGATADLIAFSTSVGLPGSWQPLVEIYRLSVLNRLPNAPDTVRD